MSRSYDQFCPAARAMDVIGGRWTVLIVRELLLGPRRFNDLVAGLPSVGPNVLADRLRELRGAGIVRQGRLPPPASVAVYELTELGEDMRPLLDELNRWGLRFLDAPRPGDAFQLGWLLGCLRASFRPELARGLRETYEARVDGDVFHVRIDDGALDVRHGPAAAPDATMTTDLTTFIAIGARLLPLDEAARQGLVEVEGDLSAAARWIEILGPHLQATGGRYGMVGAVRSRFQPDAARGVHETYEFRIGDFTFHARVDDGTVAMELGAAEGPTASMTTDLATLLGLGAGTLPISAALAAGAAAVDGAPDAALRMAAAFGITGPQA